MPSFFKACRNEWPSSLSRANVQFFSVNRWRKASKNFRSDSDSCASVIVAGNVCYNLNTIQTYFSCAIAALFSFPSHEADIRFYICSIIPFHDKKEKDQCGYRSCS